MEGDMNDDDDDEVGSENPASGVIHQNRVTVRCWLSVQVGGVSNLKKRERERTGWGKKNGVVRAGWAKEKKGLKGGRQRRGITFL